MASDLSTENVFKHIWVYIKECKVSDILNYLKNCFGPLKLELDDSVGQRIYSAGPDSSLVQICITENMDFEEPFITEVWIDAINIPWANNYEFARSFSSNVGKTVLCSPPNNHSLETIIDELDTFLEISNGQEKIYQIEDSLDQERSPI